MNISGQLKTFFDHLAYMWLSHRPKNYQRKVSVSISTAAGAGANNVCKLINKQTMWLNFGTNLKYGLNIRSKNIETIPCEKSRNIDKQLEKLAKKISKRVKKPKVSFQTKFYFKIMKMMHNSDRWNDLETKHWKENGWIKD